MFGTDTKARKAWKNCNEPNDHTREKQQKANHKFPSITRLAKAIHAEFGSMKNIFRGFHDSRQPGKCYYKITEFATSLVTQFLVGFRSGRQVDHEVASEGPALTKNMGAFCDTDSLEHLPCFKTLAHFACESDVDDWREAQYKLVKKLIASKRYASYRFHAGPQVIGGVKLSGNFYQIILDATCYASFDEKHCDECLRERVGTDENGNPIYRYYHMALVAGIVLGGELYTLDVEFIGKEGTKQDCEINAAKRLLARIKAHFPRLEILLQGDALYACRPIMDTCQEYHWALQGTLKEGAQPTIYQCFDEMKDVPGALQHAEFYIKGQPVSVNYCNNMQQYLDKADQKYSIGVLEAQVDIEVRQGARPRVVRNHESDKCHPKLHELSENPNVNFNGKSPGGQNSGNPVEASPDGEPPISPELLDDALKCFSNVMQGVAPEECNLSDQLRKGKECKYYVHKEGNRLIVTILFTWLVTYQITETNARGAVICGRERWLIESAFYTQKNVIFYIKHQRTLDPNGMKVMFYAVQMADLFLKFYRTTDSYIAEFKPGLRESAEELKKTLEYCDIYEWKDFIMNVTKLFLYRRE